MANILNSYDIPQLTWIPRSPEWINRALGLMYMFSKLEMAEPKNVVVTDNKFELPCDIKLLRAVEWKGIRLHCINNKSNSMFHEDVSQQVHVNKTYELDESGYGIVHFDCDELRIHYMRLPVEYDSDYNIWFPLIPDNQIVIDAIEQYLLMSILLKGYSIKNLSLTANNEFINPALAWNIKKKAAENSEIIKDVNELEEISKITNTFLYTNNVYDNRLFNNTKGN